MEESHDTLKYGLVEIGGFVRHRQLSQREHERMLIQERGNMVLFDMKERAPDTTDGPGTTSSGSAGVPTSSRNRVPTNAASNESNPGLASGHIAHGEEGEESEMDEDMEIEPPPGGDSGQQL